MKGKTCNICQCGATYTCRFDFKHIFMYSKHTMYVERSKIKKNHALGIYYCNNF